VPPVAKIHAHRFDHVERHGECLALGRIAAAGLRNVLRPNAEDERLAHEWPIAFGAVRRNRKREPVGKAQDQS
jgi:hypothetical protein